MMKTSSKLLIIVGVALFVLPITIMSFALLPGRVDQQEYERNMAAETATVGTEDNYLQTTKLKTFNKVLIKGEGRNGPISLIVVKSDQYALKFEKNNAVNVKFELDDNGMLTIHGKESADYYYHTVYLFAPSLHDLELQDVDLHTQIETDSLLVYGERLRGFRILPGAKIGDLHLRVKKSTLEVAGYDRDAEHNSTVDNLSLEVDSSQVSMTKQSWQRMLLSAKNSSVNLINNDKKWPVEELTIKTEGLNMINLDSLQTNKLSGRISEQTTIDLPVFQLRKLMSSN